MTITVKQLKEAIAGAKDDQLVVLSAPDHSYKPVHFAVETTAITEKDPRKRYTLSEDHESDLRDDEVRIEVIYIA